ncbi:MAG: hypothetical protein CML39_09135 [Rhodobacteraceae bacterium]|nr:MAG: hypothetical protein CML39_09135 [Paracoccaceae bacterium]
MAVSVSNSLTRILASGMESKDRVLEASIKRMATGERIHKGADDAAGMHAGSLLESQVRGLTVTVARQKETLNDLYTAEGAIIKIGDLLQRMRELTLNAQSDTLDDAERKLIHAEANSIKASIDLVATSTNSSGVNLLDGSYLNKSIQMSPAALDTMTFNISSIKADQMIFIRDDLTMKLDSTPYIFGYDEPSLQTSSANKIAAGKIALTGYEGFHEITISAGMTAKQFASTVEVLGNGINASAVTKAELFNMANASGISFRLGANSAAESAASSGTLISATITNASDLSPLVTAVNNKTGTTGVSAEISSGGASVILTDSTGDDIFISHMDFSPEGLYVSNTPEANQNSIYARALDKDGIAANVANPNLSRGAGTDETVRFIDKHRHQHIDRKQGVNSVTVNYSGSGYASAPTVTFTGGSYGTDASGSTGAIARYSANLTNGSVSSITRTNSILADRGKGYDTMPTVTLSAPPTQSFNARSAINMGTDTITLANHNFQTNDKMTYSNGGGTTLRGLYNDGRTYYAIRVDANNIKVAASVDGSAINIKPRSQSFNARSGASVSADTFSISNHPFSNGEIITYTSGGRTLRGLTDGNNYTVSNATTNSFKLSGVDVVGMLESFNAQSNVNHTTNMIAISGHGLSYNDKVTYSAGSGNAIGGLTDGADYYVKNISGSNFKLGTSSSSSTTVDIIARKTGSFNAESGVNVSNNEITVSGGHSLSNNDAVTYTTNSGTAIGGLTNGGTYYVKNLIGNTFEVSASSGGSTIDLLPEQRNFNSQSSVSGSRIYMSSHKFSLNDAVTYSAEGGTAINGLTDGQTYYVASSGSGSYVRLKSTLVGAALTISDGPSSEVHKLTGVNAGSASETHTFNGPHAGESETHTFTNQYAGPSENHSFISTQYASASQNHTFKGHTATATAVEGQDDVADPVYYGNKTLDYERAAVMVGTVSMTSPNRIRINLDHPTEKLGFYGTTFNYEANTEQEGASLPPSKTVNDVDLKTIESASKSIDYIEAGLDKFLEVSNSISVNATRLGYAVENTVNTLLHSEEAIGDVLDVDYAIETTTFTVSSMVKETSVAMLAQANAPKQAVNTLVGNVMQSQWDPTFFLVQGGGYRYKNI